MKNQSESLDAPIAKWISLEADNIINRKWVVAAQQNFAV